MATTSLLRRFPRSAYLRALALAALLAAALLALMSSGVTPQPGPMERSSFRGGAGYWLLGKDGGVFAFGDAKYFGPNRNQGNDIAGMAATASGNGYWTVDDDGDVFAYGDAIDYGSRPGPEVDDIVGFAPRTQGDGYWMVAKDGAVYQFGAAGYFGGANTLKLTRPIVGMAATPSGKGYWLIAGDGGVFAYGDAAFFGSTGNIRLNRPIVDFGPSPDGKGYRFIGNDGGVFAYGNAGFFGSTGNVILNQPIVGFAATATGKGYWLVGADGGVFSFGDATFFGSTGAVKLNAPIVAIVATPRINVPPVAKDDSATVAEDGSVTIDVQANDSRALPTSVSINTQPAHGTATVSAGRFVYTPTANYNGSDSFKYTLTDTVGHSATANVSVTVSAVNDAPVAGPKSSTTNEDISLLSSVGATDVDNDPLTFSKVSDPAHGTVTVNANGTFTYTPAANYHGPDSFTFKASDGTAQSNTATVSITVTTDNDAPVASNLSGQSTPHNTALNGSVNATDVDNDPLTFSRVLDAAHGTATVNANGSFTYTPDLLYTGSDSFTFKANDGTADSNTATVSITVTAANPSAPVAANLSAQVTSEDVSLNGTVTATDLENDSLTFNKVSDPAHGTVTVTANTGAFTYTPAANYNGSDSFTFKANDGTADSNTATVSITVTPVNDAPVASNLSGQSTAEDTVLSGSVNATDVENASLTFSKASDPAHGTVTVNANGTFTYTAAANYNGSDSFTFKANDGTADSNTATVSITVTPVNDAPLAVNDVQVTVGGTVIVLVLNNDTDPDLDTLTVEPDVMVTANGGTVVCAAVSCTYQASIFFHGVDTFSYTVKDGFGGTSTGTVTVTVP